MMAELYSYHALCPKYICKNIDVYVCMGSPDEFVLDGPTQIVPDMEPENSSLEYTKIHPSISKIYKDILPRYTKYQAAAWPPPPGPAPAPVPGPRRGGPAAAWYFEYLGVSLYILDIFRYIWIVVLVYF